VIAASRRKPLEPDTVVTKEKFISIGGWLVAIGCVWFVFDFVWPPLVVFFSWFNLPEAFSRILLPAEFATSATLVAVGILLRRSAAGKLSLSDYIVVLFGASISVLAVFSLYGWIRLPK
jgi:hypothetical protein